MLGRASQATLGACGLWLRAMVQKYRGAWPTRESARNFWHDIWFGYEGRFV